MNHSCLTMINLPYTNSYICERGGASRAMRLMISANAFVNSFVNGTWTWTRYFCAAILENVKVSQAPFHANLKKRISARLSITIGAGDAMISYPNIDEIKNVLQKARTNSQTA